MPLPTCKSWRQSYRVTKSATGSPLATTVTNLFRTARRVHLRRICRPSQGGNGRTGCHAGQVVLRQYVSQNLPYFSHSTAFGNYMLSCVVTYCGLFGGNHGRILLANLI